MEMQELLELIKNPTVTLSTTRDAIADDFKAVYKTLYSQEEYYDHFPTFLPAVLKMVHTISYKRDLSIYHNITFSSGKWTDNNKAQFETALDNATTRRSHALSIEVVCVTKYIKGVLSNIKSDFPRAEIVANTGELIKRKLGLDATVFKNGNNYLIVVDFTVNNMSNNFSYTASQQLKEVLAIYTFFSYLLDYEEPMSPELYQLIDALLKCDGEKYKATLLGILEPLKPILRPENKEQEKAALSPLFSNVNAKEINRTKNTIENLTSRLQTALAQISDYTSDIRAYEAKLVGLQLSDNDGSYDKAMELERFIKANKAIKDYTLRQQKDDTIMYVQISTPVRYFDESLLKKFISRGAYPILTPLFELMIAHPQYKILCKATLGVNPAYSNVFVPSGYGNDQYLSEDGFVNPHLIGYNCFGGNSHAIAKALSEQDYVTAISQCVAAVSNINYADGTVINYMQGRISTIGLGNLLLYNIKTKETKRFKDIEEEVRANNESS